VTRNVVCVLIPLPTDVDDPFLTVAQDEVPGEVVVGAVVFDVLDVRLACLVKGGVAGVVDAVELHGDEAHLVAGAQVVGGAGMDPFPVQVYLGIPMLDEQVVAADHGAELFGQEMVTDIGVAQAGGYTHGAGQGGEEQRLMLAVAVASLQD